MKIIHTNKVETKERKPLAKYWFGFIVAVIYLYALPIDCFYNDEALIYKFLAIAFFLFIIPYCIYFIFREFFSVKVGLAAMLFIFLINLICWPQALLKKEINLLHDDGKWIYGKIVESKFQSYDKRGGKGWYSKIEYGANDVTFLTDWEKTGLIDKYQIDDRIKLIYSEKYPKLYRLEAHWEGN